VRRSLHQVRARDYDNVLDVMYFERRALTTRRSAVICTAAVIDFSLERSVSKLDAAEAAFRKMIDQYPENRALQQAHLSRMPDRLLPPDAATVWLHSVALEYLPATLAQLRAILLQTLLNRVVVAQLLTAKTLGVSRTRLLFLWGAHMALS
jgi:hypothetical protein